MKCLECGVHISNCGDGEIIDAAMLKSHRVLNPQCDRWNRAHRPAAVGGRRIIPMLGANDTFNWMTDELIPIIPRLENDRTALAEFAAQLDRLNDEHNPTATETMLNLAQGRAVLQTTEDLYLTEAAAEWGRPPQGYGLRVNTRNPAPAPTLTEEAFNEFVDTQMRYNRERNT